MPSCVSDIHKWISKVIFCKKKKFNLKFNFPQHLKFLHPILILCRLTNEQTRHDLKPSRFHSEAQTNQLPHPKPVAHCHQYKYTIHTVLSGLLLFFLHVVFFLPFIHR